MGATGVVLTPHRNGKTGDSHAEDEPRQASLPRRLAAEAVGTFFLVLVAAGAEVVAALSADEVGLAARVAAPGLVVMALIYALGDVSGAHFNPIVTLAFAVRGVFRWSCLPAYWCAQFAAAIGAAVLLRGMFGDVAHLGANQLKVGTTATGLVTEVLLSWLLVTVILNTATRARVLGPNAAIAVGATIALCGLFAGPVTGPSMNPARSLGPALVAQYGTRWWVYALGPLIGAVLAVLVTDVVHPVRDKEEVDAAEGDHKQARREGSEVPIAPADLEDAGSPGRISGI